MPASGFICCIRLQHSPTMMSVEGHKAEITRNQAFNKLIPLHSVSHVSCVFSPCLLITSRDSRHVSPGGVIHMRWAPPPRKGGAPRRRVPVTWRLLVHSPPFSHFSLSLNTPFSLTVCACSCCSSIGPVAVEATADGVSCCAASL